MEAPRDPQELGPYEEEEVPEAQLLPAWLAETPWWAVSAGLHLLILLLLGGLVLAERGGSEKAVKALVLAGPPQLPKIDIPVEPPAEEDRPNFLKDKEKLEIKNLKHLVNVQRYQAGGQ